MVCKLESGKLSLGGGCSHAVLFDVYAHLLQWALLRAVLAILRCQGEGYSRVHKKFCLCSAYVFFCFMCVCVCLTSLFYMLDVFDFISMLLDLAGRF